jgi:hypothetical protein
MFEDIEKGKNRYGRAVANGKRASRGKKTWTSQLIGLLIK